jgi:hypothetical protein
VTIGEGRLELDEKSIFAEYLKVSSGPGTGTGIVATEEQPRQYATATAAQEDKPLVMVEKPLLGDSGFALPSPAMSMSQKLEQVLISPPVLSQEHYMARPPRTSQLPCLRRLALVDP